MHPSNYHKCMSPYLHNIATAVPSQEYRQDFLREKMKKHLSKSRTSKSIIHRIYSNSGIDKRFSVIDDFHSNGRAKVFFQKDGSLSSPSTGTRNNIYSRHAKKIYSDIARNLISDNKDFTKNDFTHVITVSCTGFFAPEPAYEIVKQLGLPTSTQRFHLGFMGCFGAFPALKMAKAFCKADHNACVMVICLELCSIHLQDSEETDSLISGSIFGDGGAGAVVSSKKPSGTCYSLDQFATSIAENSEKDMAWTIGNSGFEMVLSSYVPEIIATNLETAIEPLLQTYDIDANEIRHWALHPGGRAILDKIEENFGLKPIQIASSRKILADYGNMSSATVLFVLKHLLEQKTSVRNERVLAVAFGPGLTIESGLLTKISI